MYGVEIPRYQTMEGVPSPLQTLRKGGFLVCIQNTTTEECSAYGALLEQKGYVLYSKNEISAGSAMTQRNDFYTYIGKKSNIFLSWNPGISTVRIIVMPEDVLPCMKKPQLETEDIIEPSVTQMQLDVQGMLYVIQLPDGQYLVIDGGLKSEKDMLRLYQFLAEHAPKERTPEIVSWLFSHPHPDHIFLATEFIEKYAGEVHIQSFAYNFAAEDFTTTGSENDQAIVMYYQDLEEKIREHCPDAVVYTLHTGQIYYFKGMELEVLLTVEDIYPNVAWTCNNTSAVWRMKFDNGRTALFLGDIMKENCRQLSAIYGDYMKSDLLQLAHHGCNGGELGLYQLIDPDICFWSVKEERLTKLMLEYYRGECGRGDFNNYLRNTSIRAREHYDNTITTTILMK